MMKLTLGFSPCPNDTFIFDALVNGAIDTGELRFEPVLEDVETLNRWALEGKLDITKLSFPAYFRTRERYSLLHSGSALGRGVGPLLITAKDTPVTTNDINDASVLLPGVNTTAHLLFSFAFPQAQRKKFVVFHEIEDALLSGEADLGVIIHENRFTYQDKGLHKVVDLGALWEEKMQVPIPLGGIVIRKDLGLSLQQEVSRLIKISLQHAFDQLPHISDYVSCHAQAMSGEVMRRHIDLYVNQYSLDLGADGLQAITTLEQVYESLQSGATYRS